MDCAMERSIGLLLILLLAGCNTFATQLPTVRAQPAEREVKSFTWHDPFPDEDAGPKTFTRPLVFTQPRSDTLKDYAWRNQRAAYGFPQTFSSWNSSLPSSYGQYPVQPIWQTQPTASPLFVAPY
jgi:hypothetical protein